MSPDELSKRRRLMLCLRSLRTKPPTEFFFLLDLPNELIVLICQFLALEKDINNFSRCSHRLHELLTFDLYRHNIAHYAGSALVWAVDMGQAGTVAKMLKHGADPNRCVDPIDHRTPLTMAISANQHRIANLLLKSQKCSLDKTDKMGGCPLSAAVSRNNIAVVLSLLNYGAGARMGPTVQSSFRIALYAGYTDIMHLLLTQAVVDVNDQCHTHGAPFLIDAAYEGRSKALSLLLARTDINVEVTDRHGNTALMIAAQRGRTQAVKTLLAKGALPCAINKILESVLSLAARGGRDEVINLLLPDRRVNIESRSAAGLTPLMEAARGGHDSTVRLLLRRGADPNCRDWFQYSALSVAAVCRRPSVCRVLLEEGLVDVNVKCSQGRTPLALAISALGYTRFTYPDYDPLTAEKVLEVAQVLLSAADIDPDSEDRDGETPLTHAIGFCNTPLVELLLMQDSVKPNAQDRLGRTPLLQAAQRLIQGRPMTDVHDNQCRIITALLDTACVNVNVKDSDGRTALSHAASRGREDIVMVLIQKGADLTIVSNSGMSPLQYAKKELRLCRYGPYGPYGRRYRRHEQSRYLPTIAILKKYSGTGNTAGLFGRLFRKRGDCNIQRD
ncbi:hypothetical protein N8T08_002542 [Aspergillus melleus]|uniref:Uncharacterized protein n=1 Tax=Aspergillus melleus TaxID=138277 RepID=A0ACC3B8G0_9EURO|nr:hypothetical protein N8T08_002542 [Aspergillus melleus]